MRILLAVDGSMFSDLAIAEVGSRPWPAETEIKIVTAFQVPITPSPEVWTISDEYYPALEKIAREQATAIVDGAEAKLRNALPQSVSVAGEIVNGPPREVILDEADRWKADLIVLGSHGYGAWQRLLLGSVSQAVVSHANCSVEVVHRRKSDSDAKAA
ncbi:MAG TPA: universal stress protein [Pyrinomonadaceae bacterium]|nr:universal stress protein [Pyrinomonadaceae bacterium]